MGDTTTNETKTMKLKDILSPSFNSIRRPATDSLPLWTARLSSKSSFCRAVVQAGLLSHRQMVRAALRYRLGQSKDDAVIYWQIDQLGVVHDGKLMWYGADCHRLKHRRPTWVSHLFKKQYGLPDDAFQSVHCFFGLHLLRSLHSGRDDKTVALVEAEKSAVILSERYPQYIWLAAGGLSEVQPYKFWPLRRHKVVIFPDTDLNRTAYTRWYQAAQEVMASPYWPNDNPIRVSPILELRATLEQKRLKIDLVDYLISNL